MKFQVAMTHRKHVDVMAADMRSAITAAMQAHPDYVPETVDSLESDEGDYYAGKCEACGAVILNGDEHTCDEDCLFCEKCCERQMAG